MKKSALLFLLLLAAMTVGAANVVDLSGIWQARLQGHAAPHAVRLPGSLLTNDLGDELSVDTRWTGSLYDSSFYHNPYMAPYRRKGHMKFPFFLTPNKHYVGEVVYTRAIFVPKEWKGRKVTLFLERPHIETTVTVNGKVVGHQISLNTPHVYDVSGAIVPGKKNTIVIKVYNGIENVDVGQDSHSVTDQTQGNWNGLAGRLELQCRGRHPVGNVQVYPHGGVMMRIARADEVEFRNDISDIFSACYFTNSNGNAVAQTMFYQFYSGIFRCNSVLQHIEDASQGLLSDDFSKEARGEASFLRALYLFNLGKEFKDAPLRLKASENSSDFPLAKSSQKEIWDQAISDLETAASCLPVKAVALSKPSKGLQLLLFYMLIDKKGALCYIK